MHKEPILDRAQISEQQETRYELNYTCRPPLPEGRPARRQPKQNQIRTEARQVYMLSRRSSAGPSVTTTIPTTIEFTALRFATCTSGRSWSSFYSQILELLEGLVAADGGEVVGEGHAREVVAGAVARAVAREGSAPDVLVALLVLRERVPEDPGRREEDCNR